MLVLTFVATLIAARRVCALHIDDAVGRIDWERMGMGMGMGMGIRKTGKTQGKQDKANRQPAQEDFPPAADGRLAVASVRQHPILTRTQFDSLTSEPRSALMQINHAEPRSAAFPHINGASNRWKVKGSRT